MKSLVFKEGTKEYELMQKIVNDKEYKFPITSAKENLMNKNLDYKVLMLLTLLSNRQTDKDFEETGSQDTHRYIYKNRLYEYKDLIESLSNNKLNTILRTIKKIEKLDCKIINVVKTESNEIVYYISYAKNDKEYVTIDTKIMEALIHSFNSNVIKIYILLTYMCLKGKRRITREWLLKQIGLNSNSEANKSMITNITTELHCGGYINKETVREGNKTVNYYEVNDVDTWKKIRKYGR